MTQIKYHDIRESCCTRTSAQSAIQCRAMCACAAVPLGLVAEQQKGNAVRAGRRDAMRGLHWPTLSAASAKHITVAVANQGLDLHVNWQCAVKRNGLMIEAPAMVRGRRKGALRFYLHAPCSSCTGNAQYVTRVSKVMPAALSFW